MGNLDYKAAYRRHLPHLQPPGATFFITARLVGSIPIPVLERLEQDRAQAERRSAQIPDAAERHRRASEYQRRWFGRWDASLDLADDSPIWLKDEKVASLVA